MKPGAWKTQVGSFARQLVLPAQRQLFDYWLGLCEEDSWPRREALRPAEFRALMPNLLQIRQLPLPEGLKVEYAGHALWDIYGGELTKSTLIQGCWGQHFDYWRNVYTMLAKARVPMNGHLRNVNGSDHLVLFWLRLPMEGRDGSPWLLGLDLAVSVSQLEALLQRHAEEMGPPACDIEVSPSSPGTSSAGLG